MSGQTENTKEVLNQARCARLEKAIALEEPDRVPFVPKTSGFYMYGYGVSHYDAMKDARNMEPGIRGFLRDYDPDAVNLGGLYSIDVMEALGTSYIRWPGPTHHLPLDSGFQQLDGTYLEDDEWDEFILDPTHTMITKILPRKYTKLKGLSRLYFREEYDTGFYNDLTAFADPEVRDTLDALIAAGKAMKEKNEQMKAVRSWIAEEGYSTYSQGTFWIPFDAFADSVRGIITAMTDMYDYPDELESAVQKVTAMNVDRMVDIYAKKGAKRIFLPLHCGGDMFMSPELFLKFYWPNLKYCLDRIIEKGMTPICFFEGKYDMKLDIIKEVPKGKAIYMFESVDLKRAKETVGQNACICGSIPNVMLAFGTPEQVIEETKRQMDILAPGGGFIMDCSLMLDNAKHENIHAWKEATLKYGCY